MRGGITVPTVARELRRASTYYQLPCWTRKRFLSVSRGSRADGAASDPPTSKTTSSSSSPGHTKSKQEDAAFDSRRKAQEETDHIDRQTTENVKSSTDNAAAAMDVAFNKASKAKQEEELASQVFEVSSANPEVSQPSKLEETAVTRRVIKDGEQATIVSKGTKKVYHGGGAANKKTFKGFDNRSEEKKREDQLKHIGNP